MYSTSFVFSLFYDYAFMLSCFNMMLRCFTFRKEGDNEYMNMVVNELNDKVNKIITTTTIYL